MSRRRVGPAHQSAHPTEAACRGGGRAPPISQPTQLGLHLLCWLQVILDVEPDEPHIAAGRQLTRGVRQALGSVGLQLPLPGAL
jgi:hypothetical protein